MDCKDGETFINLQLHLHREARHQVPHHLGPSPAEAALNAAAASKQLSKLLLPTLKQWMQLAVVKTFDKALQAVPPPHQEERPSQCVLVLGEQAGQSLREEQPLQQCLEDLLCHFTERMWQPCVRLLVIFIKTNK